MALTTPVERIVQALAVRIVPAMPVAPAGDSAAPARLVTAAVATAVATVKRGVAANTEAGGAAARWIHLASAGRRLNKRVDAEAARRGQAVPRFAELGFTKR
jgi:hypothetical protein